MSFSKKLKEELSEGLSNRVNLNNAPNNIPELIKILESAKKEQNIALQSKLYSYFLSVLFLKYGNITNPEIKYHMEFNLNSKILCDATIYAFENAEPLKVSPSVIKRRNHFVVYLKDSEKITDFLVFIGAQRAAMSMMQIKMVKEVRNNINRSTNFETANLSKITNSSSKHRNAINKIKNTIGLEKLPEPLKETALLRIMNPYMSLNELSKLYEKPISKSGINHRLKKITDIAKTIQ